jgi:AcrR family transcriptional regulator
MSADPRPVPRRAPSRADGEVSRDRILDAAERLLAKRGFSGTGISAISRESGLPASSIYWFFSSKQDLAINVIERAADRWIQAFEASGEDSSLRDFFQRALEQTGSRLPDFVRLQVLMGLERGEQDPELLERFRRVRERVRPLLVPPIERAIECPDAARRLELAQDLARMAMSFAQGTLILREMDPEGTQESDEELAEDLQAAVLAVAQQRLTRERS